MNIQWYPGHMTKTRRMIAGQLKNMDAVCEILDARVPLSSRNPDVEELTGGKPRLIVLNRVDLADPAATRAWGAYFRDRGFAVLEANAKQGQGVRQFPAAVRSLLADKLAAYAEKGQAGRMIRVMILGIPNVGKSTFINKVAKKKSAKAGDRPGVTRGKQWVHVDQGIDLLDTPGILWPKFEDELTGMHLAFTGAVKDEIMDVETLGCHFMAFLGERYPQAVVDGYKLTEVPSREEGENDIAWGYRILQAAAAKRGMRVSGGELDTERMARVLLDEYRGSKLGRFTLEFPEGV